MIPTLTPFDISCRLLKLGFDQYTESSAVEYTSDYVYDEDPDHPESHRKGEIRVYDFLHWFPDDNHGENHIPMPTLHEAAAWLRDKMKTDAEVHRADSTLRQYTPYVYLSFQPYAEIGADFDEYEDALISSLVIATDKLLEHQKKLSKHL